MPELRDTNYFADQVAARYPLLPKTAVRRVCRYLMRRVATDVMDKEDVLLQSAFYAIKLKIFLHDFDIVRHNLEHEKGKRKRVYERDLRCYYEGDGPNSRPPGHKGKLKQIL